MKNSGECVKIGKYKNFCRVRKEAFVTMTEQGKVHYLLVRGYEEFHDEDEWLGIYSSWENAIAAYEREHAALETAGDSLAHAVAHRTRRCFLPAKGTTDNHFDNGR